MRTAVLSLLGSTLIVASIASSAMAAERHDKIYASERISNAFSSYYPNGIGLENQNGFGTTVPWRSGIKADDWRQSVNGG